VWWRPKNHLASSQFARAAESPSRALSVARFDEVLYSSQGFLSSFLHHENYLALIAWRMISTDRSSPHAVRRTPSNTREVARCHPTDRFLDLHRTARAEVVASDRARARACSKLPKITHQSAEYEFIQNNGTTLLYSPKPTVRSPVCFLLVQMSDPLNQNKSDHLLWPEIYTK